MLIIFFLGKAQEPDVSFFEIDFLLLSRGLSTNTVDHHQSKNNDTFSTDDDQRCWSKGLSIAIKNEFQINQHLVLGLHPVAALAKPIGNAHHVVGISTKHRDQFWCCLTSISRNISRFFLSVHYMMSNPNQIGRGIELGITYGLC